MGLDGRFYIIAVSWVQALIAVFDLVAQLMLGVAQDGFPACRIMDFTGNDISIPYTCGTAGQRQCQGCFAFSQRLGVFRYVMCRHIQLSGGLEGAGILYQLLAWLARSESALISICLCFAKSGARMTRAPEHYLFPGIHRHGPSAPE
ncbi:hypothetical protein D3C85_1538860 [compost metagenome]